MRQACHSSRAAARSGRLRPAPRLDDRRNLLVTSIFVTGSADGIGRRTAQLLVADGHRVVLHARDERRAAEALEAVPGSAAGCPPGNSPATAWSASSRSTPWPPTC